MRYGSTACIQQLHMRRRRRSERNTVPGALWAHSQPPTMMMANGPSPLLISGWFRQC
jgi:hypothetical protein